MITTYLFFAVIIMFIAQLFLCFKAKSKLLKTTPIILFAIATVILFLKAYFSVGWDGLGYIIFTICVAYIVGACLAAWAIWGIYIFIKKKKSNKTAE